MTILLLCSLRKKLSTQTCNLFPILVLGTHYEVKIHTPGMIHAGWTRPHLPAGVVVGTDHNLHSFLICGKELNLCHMILRFLLVNCVYCLIKSTLFNVVLFVFVASTVNTPTQGPTSLQDIILRLIMYLVVVTLKDQSNNITLCTILWTALLWDV